MKIAMIGAGAMGCAFGARFAQARADVIFFDHDVARVAAINAAGVLVETGGEPIHVRAPATSLPGDTGAADLAIVLVDSNATRAVAALLAATLKPEATVFTLQNGIGNVEALAAALGSERIIAGSTYNSAAVIAPGHVRHSNIGETVIGGLGGDGAARLALIEALFRHASLPLTVSDNVMGHVWMKFVLNAAINPVCAITGLRPGETVRQKSSLALMQALLDEILAVVEAAGVRLPVEDARTYVLDHAFERYNRPSMLQHVEQGRRTEIDALNGALVAQGRDLAIPCPVNETVAWIVRSLEGRDEAWRAGRNLDEAALEEAARSEQPPWR